MRTEFAPTQQDLIEKEYADFGATSYGMRHHGVPMAYLYAEFFIADRDLVKKLKEASDRFCELHTKLFDKSRGGLFGEGPLHGDFGEWLHANLDRLRMIDDDAAEMYRVDQLKYLLD